MDKVNEGNRLIAEFDGIPVDDLHMDDANEHLWAKNLSPKGISPISIKIEYHSSWDWLMPVVEKIGTICLSNEYVFVSISTDGTCTIECVNIYWEEQAEESLIKSTWLAVVEFIKYWNNNGRTL